MIKKSNNFTGPFLAAFIFVKLVLEPLSGSVFMSCCISMLPLRDFIKRFESARLSLYFIQRFR